MDEKTQKEIEAVGHIGVWGDEQRAKANREAGKTLCDECDGTGNEFYFMYRACPACGGSGVKPEAVSGENIP